MPRLCTAVFKIKVKHNPFAYLTTTVHNAFLQELEREHKHARLAEMARRITPSELLDHED